MLNTCRKNEPVITQDRQTKEHITDQSTTQRPKPPEANLSADYDKDGGFNVDQWLHDIKKKISAKLEKENGSDIRNKTESIPNNNKSHRKNETESDMECDSGYEFFSDSKIVDDFGKATNASPSTSHFESKHSNFDKRLPKSIAIISKTKEDKCDTVPLRNSNRNLDSPVYAGAKDNLVEKPKAGTSTVYCDSNYSNRDTETSISKTVEDDFDTSPLRTYVSKPYKSVYTRAEDSFIEGPKASQSTSHFESQHSNFNKWPPKSIAIISKTKEDKCDTVPLRNSNSNLDSPVYAGAKDNLVEKPKAGTSTVYCDSNYSNRDTETSISKTVEDDFDTSPLRTYVSKPYKSVYTRAEDSFIEGPKASQSTSHFESKHSNFDKRLPKSKAIISKTKEDKCDTVPLRNSNSNLDSPVYAGAKDNLVEKPKAGKSTVYCDSNYSNRDTKTSISKTVEDDFDTSPLRTYVSKPYKSVYTGAEDSFIEGPKASQSTSHFESQHSNFNKWPPKSIAIISKTKEDKCDTVPLRNSNSNLDSPVYAGAKDNLVEKPKAGKSTVYCDSNYSNRDTKTSISKTVEDDFDTSPLRTYVSKPYKSVYTGAEDSFIEGPKASQSTSHFESKHSNFDKRLPKSKAIISKTKEDKCDTVPLRNSNSNLDSPSYAGAEDNLVEKPKAGPSTVYCDSNDSNRDKWLWDTTTLISKQVEDEFGISPPRTSVSNTYKPVSARAKDNVVQGSQDVLPRRSYAKERSTTSMHNSSKMRSALWECPIGMASVTGDKEMISAGLHLTDEVRIVLLGRTGSGKSATGNTILGEPIFDSLASGSSVTSRCELGKSHTNGKDVLVVDTPGMFDTGMSIEKVTLEILKCVTIVSPGPHAFILVVEIGRFTKEEQDTVDHFIKYFGKDMVRYMIILFTRKDDLERQNTSINEYVNTLPDHIKSIILSCNGRYIAFNNILEREDRHRQAISLLKMIDKMIIQNGGLHYTNDMFKAAEIANQRLFAEERKRLLEEERLHTAKIKQMVEAEYLDELNAQDVEQKKLEEQLNKLQISYRMATEHKRELRDENKKLKQQNTTRSYRPYRSCSNTYFSDDSTDNFNERSDSQCKKINQLKTKLAEAQRKQTEAIQEQENKIKYMKAEVEKHYEQLRNATNIRENIRQKAVDEDKGVIMTVLTAVGGFFCDVVSTIGSAVGGLIKGFFSLFD